MSLKDPDAAIEKQFYTIGEVAEILSASTSLVRFWVNELKVFNLKTNKKGNRLFTQKDLEKLKQIHYLVKTKGYTLPGAKQALKKENNDETENQEYILHKLKAVKERLIQLKKMLE